MNFNKKLLICPVVYILFMGLANFVVARQPKVVYGEPSYVKAMLPYVGVLAVGATLCFLLQYKKLQVDWTNERKYLPFMFILVPTVGMAAFFVANNFKAEAAFLIPLAVTLLVGIAEEMMFRRVLFVSLMKQGDLLTAVVVSATVFSLLHSVNVLAGLGVGQMLGQLLLTYFAGIFYALMYYYTRNIALLIVSHWLWDYLLMGGASEQYEAIGGAVSAMMIAQFVVIFFFAKRLWYKEDKQEAVSAK